MTGFGEAHAHSHGLAIAVELRTVNSRHFKFSYRSSDGFAGLEPDIENLVRESVRRGTVQLNLYVDREATADDYRISVAVLESYIRQLAGMRPAHERSSPLALEALLSLPGVVIERSHSESDPHEYWPVIEPVVRQAIAGLGEMRAREGLALAHDLQEQVAQIAKHIDAIAERAPRVVEDYRQRLTERVNRALSEFEFAIEPSDLVREISLFADRSDISEELVRFKSHLNQFAAAVKQAENAGRRLEFIAQEMGREINTVGSKANDTEISHNVVEVKAALERIREQVQNVE
jgi:uncharacterized protein (TIGR00255 family)